MRNKDEKGRTFLIQEKHEELVFRDERSKKEIGVRLKYCFLFFFFFFWGAESYAQSIAARRKVVENKDSIMPFKARWAIKTNAVDWVLMLPNVTVEFDLFGSPYKYYTLSLGVRGNGSTRQNYKPYMVYNLLDVHAEFRNYFRTTQRNGVRPDSVKIGLINRMREDVFTIKRLHPRYWRAYYWGVYTDVADYMFKFGRTGVQGTAYGLGLSGGFTIPLYGYRRNFVDLELGASAGAVYAKYDKFERDVKNDSYPRVTGGSNGRILPAINEIRVAFVYRFGTSVKNKYRLVDYDKINAKTEAKQRRKYALDSIALSRFKEKERKLIKQDSVKREEAKVKELRILKKDSLKLALKQEKLLKDSLLQNQKQEKKQAKQLKREQAKKDKKAAKAKKKETPPVKDSTISTQEAVVPKEGSSNVDVNVKLQ